MFVLTNRTLSHEIHAFRFALLCIYQLTSKALFIVCATQRGDAYMHILAPLLGMTLENWSPFLCYY